MKVKTALIVSFVAVMLSAVMVSTVSEADNTTHTVTIKAGDGGTVQYVGYGAETMDIFDGENWSTTSGDLWFMPLGTVAKAVPNDGYAFVGWDPSGQSKVTSDMTFTANFAKLNTYTATLIFSANGGTGAPSTLRESITATSASGSYTFTIPDTIPTRTSSSSIPFTFTGWSTDNLGIVAQYQPGDTIEVEYGKSVILYACWVQTSYTYSVSFDVGDGSGTFDKLTYTGAETSHTFTLPSGKPTPPDGMEFLYWTDSNGIYYAGGTITLTSTNKNVTLTAYYIKERHTVTIAAGTGGSIEYVNSGSQSMLIDDGTSWSAPASGNNFGDLWFMQLGTVAKAVADDGYVFTGWDPSGTGTVTGDMTFTANFAKLNTYTATLIFSANGGTGAPSTLRESITATSASGSYTFTIPDTIPTRTSSSSIPFTFTGWSTDNLGIVAQYQPGDTIEVEYGKSVILYACWVQTSYTYSVSFDVGDGSGTFDKLTYTGAETSHTFTLPSGKPTPPAHKTFLFWEGPNETSYPAGSTITLTSTNKNVTLTAYYIDEQHDITIKAGTGGSVNRTSALAGYGSTWYTDGNVLHIGITLVTATPSSGYVFAGWAPSGSGTVTGDMTFTATFAKLYGHTATLAFNANGGTGAPNSVTATKTDTDPSASGSVQLTIPNTIPTYSGRTFVGWATSSASISASYQPGDKVTVSYGQTVTLYAVWSFEVEIVAGDGGTVSASKVTVIQGENWSSDGNVLTFESGKIVTATPSDGYVFGSWNPTGSGMVHYGETFIANFLKLYTVTIVAGDGGTVDVTEIPEVPHGTKVTIKGNVLTIGNTTITATPNEGYGFASWTPSISQILGDVTITANFGLMVGYKITFDANGGTGAPDALTDSTIGASATFTIPDSIPTKQGQEFLGWAYSQMSTSPDYLPGDTITLTSEYPEIILYALWSSPGIAYIVEFDGNGGNTQLSPLAWQGPASSHTFTIPEDIPTRSGYKFTGWEAVYDGSASGTVYSPGAEITLSSELPRVVLRAIWDAASYGDPFTLYAREGGWEYDGKIYPYDTVTLFYSASETIHIDGKEYSPGHLYIQLGTYGTVLDLGPSSPDFDIVLDGSWAVSTAFYSGDTSTTTKTEMSPWGWNWDMTLVGLVFLGLLAAIAIAANALSSSGLRPMDWIIIAIAGITGIFMLASSA